MCITQKYYIEPFKNKQQVRLDRQKRQYHYRDNFKKLLECKYAKLRIIHK